MLEPIGNFLGWAFFAAIVLSLLIISNRRAKVGLQQEEILRRNGVELDAEILARYEAGELKGSEKAKARQSVWAPYDTNELELRYTYEGKEIISRGLVSAETYIQTRGLTTLRIKILPEQPEQWVPLS